MIWTLESHLLHTSPSKHWGWVLFCSKLKCWQACFYLCIHQLHLHWLQTCKRRIQTCTQVWQAQLFVTADAFLAMQKWPSRRKMNLSYLLYCVGCISMKPCTQVAHQKLWQFYRQCSCCCVHRGCYASTSMPSRSRSVAQSVCLASADGWGQADWFTEGNCKSRNTFVPTCRIRGNCVW